MRIFCLLIAGAGFLATAPAEANAQGVRYMKGGAGGLESSVRAVEDTHKLVLAGALTELPRFACPTDAGDKIVLLNKFATDYQDDGTHLVVWRVKVVSGRSKGCIGYVLPSMFQRTKP